MFSQYFRISNNMSTYSERPTGAGFNFAGRHKMTFFGVASKIKKAGAHFRKTSPRGIPLDPLSSASDHPHHRQDRASSIKRGRKKLYELTWEDSTSCKRCQAEGTESIDFIIARNGWRNGTQYQMSCRHGGNCVCGRATQRLWEN